MNDREKLDDYLWDPASPADPDVAAFEDQLGALRFEPARRPVVLPRPARTWRRPIIALAIAASLLLASGAALWNWRWSWPNARPWTLATGTSKRAFEVGRGITLAPGDRGVANIGRIGTMRVGGGTSIELRATSGRRHRLRMTAGDIYVRVWAPPGSVVVETPAGEVIDMGCEFVLTVNGDTTSVRVLSGWVQLENADDEVQIPAGASSLMSTAGPPGAPVYDDATAPFREAIRSFERDGGDAALAEALRLARVRDVYTLLRVADKHPRVAEVILRRASQLSPPPEDVTIGRILRGDRETLWRWAGSLPLPPPKSKWWLNWRDALPVWR